MADAKTYDELVPLVEEEGEGIVISHADCEKAWELKELFPDEEPNYDEALAEMDDDQAAMLVGVIFEEVFKTTVDQQACDTFDQEEQSWTGTVQGFAWEISVDGDNYLLDVTADEEV